MDRRPSNPRPGEDEGAEANRITSSLAALAFALLLVVIGLVLVRHLAEKSRVEDCIMTGRINCDAVLSAKR